VTFHGLSGLVFSVIELVRSKDVQRVPAVSLTAFPMNHEALVFTAHHHSFVNNIFLLTNAARMRLHIDGLP
jgi:hypothetical protein